MWPAFFTTILFSISAVCGQRTARLLGGNEANFWRLCFAALLLAIYAHLFGAGLRGAALWIFLVSGCIGFGFGDAALFQALPRIGSRLSVLMVLCLSSPMAAVMEWAWLRTTLTIQEIAGGILVLGGVAIALAPGRSTEGASRQFSVGLIFGFIAAVCQAIGAVMSRKAFAVSDAAAQNIDGITAAYQRILGGIVVTAVFVLIARRAAESSRDRSELWRKAWPWVLLNGLSGPALGVSCYQWALKVAPTGVVLPIVALTPIVILPFSRYIEGERPTLRSLLGGAVAVVGAVLLGLTRG